MKLIDSEAEIVRVRNRTPEQERLGGLALSGIGASIAVGCGFAAHEEISTSIESLGNASNLDQALQAIWDSAIFSSAVTMGAGIAVYGINLFRKHRQ